jgi:hypothetical protein
MYSYATPTLNAVFYNLGILLVRSSISKILLEESLSNRLDEFQAYRTRMNDRIAEIDHLGTKRFFNLDSIAYKDGAACVSLCLTVGFGGPR